ncbi:DUF6502 family protein [Humitalea sp. 24SJ18S-53]|uniref:DUF6502 family protein n=1 Tax=Humitalea sp. 24SJ18S-53 TaxID=3422307 RepID=UPI003D676716
MPDHPPPHPDPRPPPPEALLRPLRRLLRPLVRLLIRAGVTFPVLADLLRGLYVEVAAQDLPPGTAARSDSRLTLLTGVHRKELRRLRENPPPPDGVPPAVVTLTSQVMSRWLGLPAYTDAAGAPLPLPRAGGAPSFDALVASVTTDLRPRTVLDNWLAQGIVTLDAMDRVHLDVSAFVPREGREAQLFYFARNLHDHIAAAAANVSAPDAAPFLERSLHYDRLPPAAAEHLEAEGRAAAKRLLVDLNRLALSLVEETTGEAPPTTVTRRLNLGIYLYTEDEPPP